MKRRAARGSSLVELMVGLAIGLVVLSAALAGLAQQAAHSRQLLTAVRLDHEVQAAAVLAVRHLRRTGHRADADQAVWRAESSPSASPGPHNPHTLSAHEPSRLDFSYDVAGSGASDTASPAGARAFGLRRQDHRLQFLLGASGWQALHDDQALAVTSFDARLHTRDTPLGPPCAEACAPGAACGAQVRHVRLDLQWSATAPRVPLWHRTLQRQVLVRTPFVTEACPG